jgi:hypothetical protein
VNAAYYLTCCQNYITLLKHKNQLLKNQLFKNVQIQIKYIILHLHMCFIDYVKGNSIQETLVNVFLMLYFTVVSMATSYHTCSVFLLCRLEIGTSCAWLFFSIIDQNVYDVDI